MRIIIANCEVVYQGRGYTELPVGIRAIIIKEDGAISVHAEYNGNKPLNYMSAGNHLEVTKYENHSVWKFSSKKESIEVVIHEVLSDTDFTLAVIEPGLTKQRTEKDLQKFLAENPDSILSFYNTKFTRGEVIREYNTKAGAVDIFIVDEEKKTVYLIEVKRTAMLGAVDQCRRYRSAFIEQNTIYSDYDLKVAIAAWDIRPNTVLLAGKHDIDCITLPLSIDIKSDNSA
jgi:RecB family endonuclease NucS